jgi:hypothetical protein
MYATIGSRCANERLDSVNGDLIATSIHWLFCGSITAPIRRLGTTAKPLTLGIHLIGFTVRDLTLTRDFFINRLEWTQVDVGLHHLALRVGSQAAPWEVFEGVQMARRRS